MKLRTRFILFSVFLITIVLSGTSFVTLHFLKALVLEEIKSNQTTLVENLKKVCEESQISRDDIFAYNYITSLQKTVKGIAYAIFIDIERKLILGKNDIFMETMRGTSLKKMESLEREERFILADGRKVLSYSKRLPLSEGKWGAVHLGFFEDKIEETIQQSVQQITTIILYVALSAFFIGLIVSLLFAIQLTRPIKNLAEGAKAIGDGNLDTQIDIKRKDEIGLLADEFNTMAVKLKELDQLKDAFVSSVSHELRSPLTAISGYVELITMKPINELNPEKTKKALTIIQESTTRLTQFVNDILDVAKIKAGKMEIHKTSFDIRETAESVFGLFHPLFEKKKIVAEIKVSSDVPILFADGEKIRQVITNFLSNALKFTPEGGQVILSAIKNHSENGTVTISVKDSGIGIPKEHHHLIFGKFQQVKNKKSPSGVKGTGLGLAIAKGIVEAHGGEIGFESEENQGSTFYFTLPLQKEGGKEMVDSKKLA